MPVEPKALRRVLLLGAIMVRSLAVALALVFVVLPGLCVEGLVESPPSVNVHSGPYLSIASVGSVLTAASPDRILLFAITPRADAYIVQAGELLLDSSYGEVESLVGAGNLLVVCHRAAISLAEAASVETARVVGGMALRGPLKGVARIGSCLYAVCLPSELVVIDISSPQSPKSIVTVPITDRPTGVMATGTTILVSLAGETTEILDVSSPHRPTSVGFMANVMPVVSPRPGMVYGWSNRQERQGGVLFNVAGQRRLAALPISDAGTPAAACVSEAKVYWVDGEGKVSIIETSESPELVGHINLDTPVADLVPCQGMLWGLTVADGSLLAIDPKVYEPFSGEQAAESALASKGGPWEPPSLGSSWVTRFAARRPAAQSAPTVRTPSRPPADQGQSIQPTPPSARSTSPTDASPNRRTSARRVLRFDDSFSRLMPHSGGSRSAGETSEPRIKRIIIDNRGWILPNY